MINVQTVYTENWKTLVREIRQTHKYVVRRSNCLQIITHPILINRSSAMPEDTFWKLASCFQKLLGNAKSINSPRKSQVGGVRIP